ncbi:AfsR/SARP family transcriptional regulator [Streptomyces sp. NBC_01264]|uniref:AfsR/SARP family transcriptional regulator n=1 Tax=Streptomyces sp. NBC_01264 TaxID=2903804 RepID=UPI002252986E|nr:BTAD domain-containing putative transcriptional regulator [Streptomyces sp. NBC_01264]MCX4779932.1 tetratricopeptide repeat protein [Streptomyces sp. NBC_01264]
MRFGLLGTLLVEDADGAARPLSAPKTRTLLAALLLRPNTVVSWDAVKSAVWGGTPPATAHASLHNHVARLRRALEGADGAPSRLRVSPEGFLLHVEEGELDSAVFEDRMRRARDARLRGDWPEVGTHTRAALALWRGTPLNDVNLMDGEPDSPAGRLEEMRLQILEWHYEGELHQGRHHGIAAELGDLVAAHPLRETFHGRLMLALYRDGRQADALRAYDTVRRTIREELGVGPGPELVALYQRILALDPELAAPPAEQSVTAAVGRPETAASPVPNQLPAAISDFIGRGRELARIVDELTAAGGPDGAVGATVVVHRVAGGGGMGKTTLTVQAAHRVRTRFPDGQVFLDLGGTTAAPMPPDIALGHLLRDLGLPSQDTPSGLQARVALFRSLIADRRMLLLLDDAGDAAQVRPLLPGIGGSAVLVTSRRRLNSLPGTRVDLGALSDEEAYQLLASIAGTDRVAAFPSATAEVIRVCGGMPLALRLAGARLAARPSWTTKDLARRLSVHGRALHELHADDLHVRAALLVSYDQLAQDCASCSTHDLPNHTRAFRLLGLLPGGTFAVAAAAAMLGDDEDATEDRLEHLVDAQLLDSPEPGRYQFHCLVQELARELCVETDAREDRSAAVERLVMWYLHRADEATGLLAPIARRIPLDRSDRTSSFTSYEEARLWCATEVANATAVVRLAHESGLHDLSWKLAAAMWAYYRLGSKDEWLTTHRIGLDAARKAGDESAEAWMLNGLGNQVARTAAPPESAIPHFRAAVDIHRRTPGREVQIASILSNIGVVYTDTGDDAKALEHYEEALEHYGRAGAPEQSAATLNNLADALGKLGRHTEALDALSRAEVIQRATEDHFSLAVGLSTRAEVLHSAARPAEALDAFRRALSIQEQIGDEYGQACALGHLGVSHAEQGQLEEAAACWERALRIYAKGGESGKATELRARLEALREPA